MKPALVTGAGGFLGRHMVRLLLERGQKVRALTRRAAVVEGVECVTGDIRDPEACARAVFGCGVVYHMAADYRLWAARPAELHESNVDGTRNMLEAARRARVDRFVYTSTVGCIGIPEGAVGDEETPVTEAAMAGAYKKSKYLAEREAARAAGEGLPVVIVNPTAPVGEGDAKPTPTGRVIVDYLKGRMPAYVDTGLNLVDARDVAAGHLAACERGRDGERYILGCENLTLREIFGRLEKLSGVEAPRVRIPYSVAMAAGWISTAWAGVTGEAPRAPLEGVRMSRTKMWVSHEKAARELDYAPGPVGAALRRAVEWYRGNGYC